MKVLHVFKTYYPDTFGGVEQVIFQLAEGGRRCGINSEVLSLSKHGSIQNQIVGNHYTHKSKQDFYVASTGFSFTMFRDFKRLVSHADIIHYHFPWPFMDLLHFVTHVKKPSVLTYHSDIIKQKKLLILYKPLMKQFLGSVDQIVVTSPNYLKTSTILSKYKEKISIIPIGLDRTTYPPATTGRLHYWKSKLKARFFLFVGSLRYYKGLHILLDAMQGIDLPVVIVGAGDIEVELKKRALQLGLQNTLFLGALPNEDKYALLELCYSVVFPSHLRSEAFGIALLEGAMYAKPMISSEIGTGTSYININGETGLIVPPSNSKALKKAMLALWDNTSLTQYYGSQALKRYHKLFTAEKMVEQYDELYNKLLKS